MALALVDDLTDERLPEGWPPTTITVDDATVELDLSSASQEKLRELLAPYFSAGRHPAAEDPAVVAAIEEWIAAEPQASPPVPEPEPEVAATPAPEPERAADPEPEPPLAPRPATDGQVRAWAKRYGVVCNVRGQVQLSVRRLYEASAGGPPLRAERRDPEPEPVDLDEPGPAPADEPAAPALDAHAQHREAAEDLIERGIRLPVIANQLGVPLDVVRGWHRELSGVPS